MLLKVLLFLALGMASEVTGQMKRVCYYSNWSQYRPAPMKFFPEDVDVNLCTHFIYAFATMNGNRLAAYEWNDEDEPWAKGMYSRFNDHIHLNSNGKTLIAVGGWNFGTQKMTEMLATEASQQEFVDTSITFCRERNFDGLDLDFEYPGSRGSPPEDKQRFTALVQKLRAAFNQEAIDTGREPLLLTAALDVGKSTIDAGYEVALLAPEFDFINVMTYDLWGAWETVTGHNSPYFKGLPEYTGREAELNQDWALRYYVELGAPKEKLIVGMATYGRCFHLTDPTQTHIGAPVSGGCSAGQFTREAGFLAYYEVCKHVQDGSAGFYRLDDGAGVPVAYKGETWIGYDDVHSLTNKAQYVTAEGYGGIMIWDLDLDDFNGMQCDEGKYPLLRALNDALGVVLPTTTPGPATTTTAGTPAPSTTTAAGGTTTTRSGNDMVCGFFSPSSCAGVAHGQYPSPENCYDAIVCDPTGHFVMPCGHGTLLHPETGECVFNYNIYENPELNQYLCCKCANEGLNC